MKCILSTCLSGDRPSYRDQAGDYPSSRGGDYRMYGALAGPGDTAAFIEPGTRGRAGYYGASNYRGQVGLAVMGSGTARLPLELSTGLSHCLQKAKLISDSTGGLVSKDP